MRFHYYRKRDSKEEKKNEKRQAEELAKAGPSGQLSHKELLHHIRKSHGGPASYAPHDYPMLRFVFDLMCIPAITGAYAGLMRHYAKKHNASNSELDTLDSYLWPLLLLIMVVSAFDIWSSRHIINRWARDIDYCAWLCIETVEEEEEEAQKTTLALDTKDQSFSQTNWKHHLHVLEAHLAAIRNQLGVHPTKSDAASRADDLETAQIGGDPDIDQPAWCGFAGLEDGDAALRQRGRQSDPDGTETVKLTM